MADISARIDLYAEAMAKQARWQAECEAATKDVERVLAATMLENQKTLADHLVNRVIFLLALVLPITFGGLFFLVWFATRRLNS